MIKITLPLVFFLLPFSYLFAQMAENEVTIVGQMKNVMWKGELSGTIQLDTLSNKKGLYGFGPMEYLRGELLILDGITYKSGVFFMYIKNYRLSSMSSCLDSPCMYLNV